MATKFAVWGDPISHSLSPIIHQAAYDFLNYDWSYGRAQQNESSFQNAISLLDPEIRGLSLTMPLKKVAAEFADQLDRNSELSSSVNTLLFNDKTVRGFNTDVAGIVSAFETIGVAQASVARIIGAGATSASAILAAHDMGVKRLQLLARRPAAMLPLLELANRIEIDAEAICLSDLPETKLCSADVTVSTVPAGAEFQKNILNALVSSGGALLDVIYAEPTQITDNWPDDQAVVNGLAMLLGQALRQIRIFRYGNPDETLPEEAQVLEVMASAVADASA